MAAVGEFVDFFELTAMYFAWGKGDGHFFFFFSCFDVTFLGYEVVVGSVVSLEEVVVFGLIV